MASRTYLEVRLPEGHVPRVDDLPADLEALLAETGLGGGIGFEGREDGRWWFHMMVRGPDRLGVAEALADRLDELGHRSLVRNRR